MGHTHDEDIEVVRAINSTDPIGFNLITASGTSGDNMNPSFTVIDFDEEFMVPVNTHTYYLNLTEANALPADQKPVWHELHDMVKEYDLEDMSPSSMKKLSERLYNDVDLASQYDWNRIRRGGEPNTRPTAKLHDLRYLGLQASETFELKDLLKEKHIDMLHPDISTFFEYLIGNWIYVEPETEL